MSDNKKGTNPKLGGLTPRELELAALVFQCFEGGLPKINFAKLADIAGFKNPQSASACWNPAKKKLMALGDAATAAANKGGADGEDGGGGDDGGAAPATPKSKATPKKRKPKTEDGEDDATPSAKKPRAKKAAKAASTPVKEEKEEVDNDDDEVDAKPGFMDYMLEYEQPDVDNAV